MSATDVSIITYVCDGCRRPIYQKIEISTRELPIVIESDVVHLGDRGHLCGDCHAIVDNLISQGLIKVREVLQGVQP